MKNWKKVLSVMLILTFAFGGTSAFAADWCTKISTYWIDAHYWTECGQSKALSQSVRSASSQVDSALGSYSSAVTACVNAGFKMSDFGPAAVYLTFAAGSGILSTQPALYLMFEPAFAFYAGALADEAASLMAQGYSQVQAKQQLESALRALQTAQSNFDYAQRNFLSHYNLNHCAHYAP